MSEEENRNALKRYVQALAQQDLDAMEALLHDDYLEEYPQSGERIRGKHTQLAQHTGQLSWPA